MKELERILLIIANAGSGKTYRLVTRCLELISRGEPPDKILALTFTRKAAAEFMQKLFLRLSEAAEDRDALAGLAAELGDPKLNREQCVLWLGKLVTALPRMSMGTMDQFFGRIARAFRFELGLGREFRIIDEAEQDEHRRRVLDRIFSTASESKGGIEDLVELLRQESRNRAGQSVMRTMERVAFSLQQNYLETPADIVWGDPATIWPTGSAILRAGVAADIADEMAREIEKTNPDLGPKAVDKWSAWLQMARDYRPPQRMSAELVRFVAEKLDDVRTGEDGGEYIPFGRAVIDRLHLWGRLGELRLQLRHAMIKLEIEAKLSSSRGLHSLLARYEDVYDTAVRESGAMTFSDVTMLLAEGAGEPWRQDMDYRLDGRHDHWLLDEFQDTSRTQWKIMEPLADEIIQDTSGARSFFYVGDTKQAIYGWRGGDARLFWEIRDRYNQGKSRVVREEKLEVSRRSTRAIVRVVEKVLNPETLKAGADEFRFPPGSVDDWRRAWVEHLPSSQAAEGYARFETVNAGDDSDESLAQAVLAILREVEPLERGLDCAILVRTNDELARYVSVLRAAGIPAAAEGKTNPCLSTPAGVALLSLARWIASPADHISKCHFEASPLRSIASGGDMDVFVHDAMQAAASRGSAPLFRAWVQQARDAGIVATGELDAFLAAVADFDSSRQAAGDWRGLVHFIEHRKLEEGETPGAVRVMTIHQSKGLGVDMVILPELGGKAMTEFREGAGVSLHRDERGEVRWGLSLPRKEFCEADPVLQSAREEIRARQSYEALCVLYVAMTRAKKALYCLASSGRDNKNAGNWLEKNFPGRDGDSARREEGEAEWFKEHAKMVDPSATDPEPSLLPVGEHRATQSPSRERTGDMGALFTDTASRRLGSEVHRILQHIEWIGKNTPEIPGDDEAVVLTRKFLESPLAREIFTQPDHAVMLWRERAFDVETEGQMTSGVFDRVHVKLDASGRPVAAQIFDYKVTNEEESNLQKNYAGQLGLYRQAAAKLLDLPMESVEARAVVVPV